MQIKTQLTAIIITLLVLGFGSAIYKSQTLGFSFTPADKISVWTIEAAISLKADEGPTEVSLNLPDSTESLAVLDIKSVSSGYSFEMKNGRAVWKGNETSGNQQLFLRGTVALRKSSDKVKPRLFSPIEGDFSKSASSALAAIVERIPKNVNIKEKAALLLAELNSTESSEAKVLLDETDTFGGKTQLACALLGKADIPARPVKGISLVTKQRTSPLKSYIEILDNKNLVIFDPLSAEEEAIATILLWQEYQESILDLIGATGGKVTFSVLQGKMAAERVAILHGKHTKNLLIDFSIYSLPIKDQNTFKLLLLIPIGALVVVVLRNLVGIPTSGTFMPILIALVFLQTELISGLILFLTVVGVGLVLRSYLSHLNLLLVPRISAVLVFVILIYVVISVGSYKMGITSGMQVTFFPMIIIAWTIERLSVLWEEEGPRDVFKQGGGSLFAASIIYLVMSNSYVEHITYSFPELLLVVLAVIIMIGSYSGYRLTELRRFEPLAGGN